MPKQIEIIGDCTLYLGDTMEILPELGECADLLVSDPPYELTYGGCHGSLGGKLSTENYDNKGGIVTCDIDWGDFMPVLYGSLRRDSHAYIMCNNRHVQNMLNEADKSGFRFHNLLVWDKGTATPNRWYMKNCEFTGFFYKGKAKFLNDCGAKQYIHVPQEQWGGHPTPKPTALMQHYIENSTKAGETVLDPFMGVASTGVACARSNRKFIGIELDQKYFDLACKRVEEAYKQGDLFMPTVQAAKQEKFI